VVRQAVPAPIYCAVCVLGVSPNTQTAQLETPDLRSRSLTDLLGAASLGPRPVLRFYPLTQKIAQMGFTLHSRTG